MSLPLSSCLPIALLLTVPGAEQGVQGVRHGGLESSPLRSPWDANAWEAHSGKLFWHRLDKAADPLPRTSGHPVDTAEPRSVAAPFRRPTEK